MVGQGGEVVVEGAGMERLDGLSHPAVHGHPARHGELVVQRGSDQGVTEAVAGSGRRHLVKEAGGDCLLQGREESVLREVPSRSDQGRFELEAGHRCYRQSPVGTPGQPGEAPADHVPHPFGDAQILHRGCCGPAAIPSLDPAGLGQVAKDLGHEEWVPFRFGPHRLGQRLVLLE